VEEGQLSKRKPHNDQLGYVSERKCKLGGHIVILDRQNGADWIDADERWVVVHEPSTLHVSVTSLKAARSIMSGVATASTPDEARQFADIIP
jgi:hypothetical protein